MLIGVPTETAAGELRVALTPQTAKKLKAQGHQLFVQFSAGVDNELIYMDKTMMVFGDARKIVQDMIKAVE
jgi:alanine dehydrogenase